MPLRCFKKALAPFISPTFSALLQHDKVTFTFEAIGDGKVRVNCQSWDDAKIILADQALQVVALGKILHVMRAARPAST